MLPLEDAFLELAGTIINASICCDVWWELQNLENPSHESYRVVVDRYELFFEANAGAQLVAMVVLLYQAYEKRSDTQNFYHIIERLKKEDPTSVDVVVSVQKRIDDLMPIWKKVARARSSAIAHLSYRASSSVLMESAELTPNEIRDLLVKSKEILKVVAAHLQLLGTATLEMSAVPHTRELMKALETSVLSPR